MRRVFASIGIAFALFVGVAERCEGVGLAIHPMEQFITPGESAEYIASNQSDKAIAVEVIPESWTITEDGEEVREVTKDLVIYPSQFILKGTTYKKVKVGVRASARQIDKEKCYRVTVRELPINLEGDEPGTYRIYRASAYRTSFYLQPKRAKPKLVVVDSTLQDKRLTMRFRNDGSQHIHLRNPELTVVDSNGKSHVIEPLEFYEPINSENMHAGITRVFHLDMEHLDLPAELTRGTLRFNDGGSLQDKTFELNWR